MDARNREPSPFRHVVQFVLLYAVSANCLAIPPVANDDAGNTAHFRLYHRSELNSTKTADRSNNVDPVAHMKEIAARDLDRQQAISKALASRRRRTAEIGMATVITHPDSFLASIFSGAYAGTGEYFVRLQMGTPVRQYLLIADTGSDLTWTKCGNDSIQRGRRRKRQVLNSGLSSTFVPIQCSSGLCKDVLSATLAECPTPSSPCKYDFRYVDGSFTRGVYGNETVAVSDSIGNELKIPGVSVGCSSEFQGPTFGKADGVLGLGQSGASFAVTTAQLYSGRFSYCLVHHLSRSGRNYLVFGKNPRLDNPNLDVRTVPLVMDSAIQPYYGLPINGISFNGTMLPIPESVWNFSISDTGSIDGGVIIDSGMTLTCLVKPAYDVMIAAFREYLRDLRTFQFDSFELCFNKTMVSQAKVVPQLVVHFSGGAIFRPLAQSYLMEVAPGVRCVGFVPGDWPGLSVIGNILQERHIWEYDLLEGILRFAPSACRT